MKTFGEQLYHYRQNELQMSREDFATELSAHPIYKIDSVQIEKWENNQELEKITKPVFSLIVETIEKEGKARGWDDKKIFTMKQNFAEAKTFPEDVKFSEVLSQYRKKLRMTADEFVESLGVKNVPTANAIKNIEEGAAPNIAFVHATTDLLSNCTVDRAAPLITLKDKATFLDAGLSFAEKLDAQKAENGTAEQTASGKSKVAPQHYVRQLVREIRCILAQNEQALSDGDIAKISGIQPYYLSKYINNQTLFLKPQHEANLINYLQRTQGNSEDFSAKRARLIKITTALQSEKYEKAIPKAEMELHAQYDVAIRKPTEKARFTRR